MPFTSVVYVLFFLITALFYYILPGKFRWVWILLASIFFYMYARPAYIIIPFFTILVTYYAGIQIEKATAPNKSKLFYLTGIVFNIGLLVFFKYTNFFSSVAFDIANFTRQKIFNSPEKSDNFLLTDLVVPLGISYITFQAIGYLIEIKRGNHLPEKNLGHFATYLLFFPKITAGPVERAHHFLPQLRQEKPFKYENVSIGFKLIIWGLFKKLVVADRLSIYVNTVLGNAGHHSGITLVVGAIFYVFQLYADFSGYTDMALGCAKVLGFDLIQNFNRPLLAKSITELWRKWHISLSSWFTDYFYTPITIARRDWGKWAVVYAFFVTFIVLGFWHGPNWTFIVFGALHGLILAIEFFTRKIRKKIRKNIPELVNSIAGIAFTILYFAFTLIFFRADSLAEAFTIIGRIFTGRGSIYLENPSIFLFSLLGICFIYLVDIKKEYYDKLFLIAANRRWFLRLAYYCLLVLAILIAGVFDGGEFIYFQF